MRHWKTVSRNLYKLKNKIYFIITFNYSSRLFTLKNKASHPNNNFKKIYNNYNNNETSLPDKTK